MQPAQDALYERKRSAVSLVTADPSCDCEYGLKLGAKIPHSLCSLAKMPHPANHRTCAKKPRS
ncbi:hypothetical protein BN874_1510030 [Candidatus Contendobacter odensis Run_B_J11]|uniref:Uncharacterized protein n=1 Tax=Candidatus Contendobacter odensis Run_B_J11 TaxID=1400861 RepID=A0A7U7G909_9GAMM|nr:hypothetical protein BN874_1510030 [Candidatus Contendobacter odensis Run_B_J11]